MECSQFRGQSHLNVLEKISEALYVYTIYPTSPMAALVSPSWPALSPVTPMRH